MNYGLQLSSQISDLLFLFFLRSGRKAPEKTKKRNERCLSGAASIVAMLKYSRRNPLGDDDVLRAVVCDIVLLFFRFFCIVRNIHFHYLIFNVGSFLPKDAT